MIERSFRLSPVTCLSGAFALDGWSAARLLHPPLSGKTQLDMLRQQARCLPALRLSANFRVRMFIARSGDSYEKSEIPLRELESAIASASMLSSTFTITLDVAEARAAPRFFFPPANGLAG
jgi:hypothetical protein